MSAMNLNPNHSWYSRRWENGLNISSTALLRSQTKSRFIKSLITRTSWILWSQSKIKSTSIISFKATKKPFFPLETNFRGQSNLSINGFNSQNTWKKIRSNFSRKKSSQKNQFCLQRNQLKDQRPQAVRNPKFRLKRAKNLLKEWKRIQLTTER